MFFEVLPEIDYKFDKRDIRKVENIVISVDPIESVYDLSYFDSMVLGEQTPEELSHELYGDTQYYWTLLYVNKIVNPYIDWVMSRSSLDEYCEIKYGSAEAVLEPREFVNITTKLIAVGVEHEKLLKEYNDTNVVPLGFNLITNYEYEQRINDEKRYVYYVPPQSLVNFVDRFQTALRTNVNEVRRY